MKTFLLFIHQLPQNLLGLLVILVTGSFKTKDGSYWVCNKYGFGVSLGFFIIFGDMDGRWSPTVRDYKHEQGHQKQSLYLGWFYLLFVGIPSVVGNLWDKWFHKSWTFTRRYQWYYSRYPEKWADELGGVTRDFSPIKKI